MMNRIGPAAGAAAGILLAATVVPAVGGAYWTNVAILTLLWVYVCTAWNVVGGFAGQMSFGNAAFFGIGAYTSTYLAAQTGLSPWLGMGLGGVLAAGAALMVGYISFRWGVSHLVFALVTLAFDFALLYVVSGVGALGGVNGLFVTDQTLPLWLGRLEGRIGHLVLLAALTSALLLLVGWLHGSRLGFFWRAVRENEQAAAAAGINVLRVKQSAFALSAGATALAGSFYAQYVGFIDPESVFGIDLAIQMVLFTIVGGNGTLVGPVLGPALLVPLGEVLRTHLGGRFAAGVHHLVYGLALIAILLLLPEGLAGLAGRLRRRRRAAEPAARREAASEPPAAAKAPRRTAGGPLLTVVSVSKRFGGLEALRGVSLSVAEGEIFGVIGPNGAGKTTLFAILSGFLSPSDGCVLLEGRRIEGRPPHEVCKLGVARTFQITQTFPRFSVAETVLTAALTRHREPAARRLAERVLDRVGLRARREARAASLTLAEQRRLEIAKALATEPRVLLLDEVMAGLTPVEMDDAIRLIGGLREEGMTVIVIEHVIRAVMRLCDRVLVLDAGEVVGLGSPAEVARDPRVIEAYLGTPSGEPHRSAAVAAGEGPSSAAARRRER